ncbi:MAG: HlyD family efflux transporter periplasmic adaptor subunit [Clostridia bacterium]|nr:HlyD family efflux transporter periplasmic adaptor subunit [Clostridia bacterium]
MRIIFNPILNILKKIKALIIKRKKLSIFMGIILMIVIVVSSLGAKADTTMASRTAVVMREDIEYRVKVNGIVESLNEQIILSPVQGTIKEMKVEQGQNVQEGDLLAVIDTTDIDEKIEKARINLELEKAKLKMSQVDKNSAKVSLSDLEQKYNFLKDKYEANLRLFQEGAVSKVSLDEAKMAMDEANNNYIIAKNEVEDGSYVQNLSLQKNRVNLAELEYTSLQSEREKHFIKSPIEGIVAEIYMKLGDTIGYQKQFFYIVNNNKMEVKANISEYDAKNVAVGDKVTVTSDGIDEHIYESELTFISPFAKKLQSSQGTESVVEVKTIIDDEKSVLKSGFNVTVDILCDRKEDVLTVPYEAILTTKDGTQYIFVVEGENHKKYQIETGIEGSLTVEVIADGIKEGDIVELNPMEDLLNQEVNVSEAGVQND